VIVERDASRGERDALAVERDRLSAEIDVRRREIVELRQMLADRDARIATLVSREDEGEREELQALESLLRERGAKVRALETALAETERFGRELVLELADTREQPAAPGGELKDSLDRLARVNAEREADLAAARWSIEELETRLLETNGDQEKRRDLERALELAQARLQEQASLITQLRGGS
jgi:chromosome segregation ATPase